MYNELAAAEPAATWTVNARRQLFGAAIGASSCLLLAVGPAWAAEEGSAAEQESDVDAPLSANELAQYQRLSRPRSGYARFFMTVAFGRGLRFNNPFRLRTQLGDSAESVSLTAPYFDLGLGLAFGDPLGMQHGPSLHLAAATEGVSQQAIGASYMLLYRGSSPLLGYGRLGASLLTAPDANLGGELAVGGAFFFTGALGVSAELVGNLFYGAGSYEAQFTVVPIVSAQAGIIVDLEVLP